MINCEILAKRMRYIVPFMFAPKTETLSNNDVIVGLDGHEDEHGGK